MKVDPVGVWKASNDNFFVHFKGGAMSKVTSSILLIFVLSNCRTLNRSHLSEVNLEEFSTHSCLNEPEPGKTFQTDSEFEEILNGFEANDFVTRSRNQYLLNDLLLNQNHEGRIRFLINKSLSANTSSEVRARLNTALEVCSMAARKHVPKCTSGPKEGWALVDPHVQKEFLFPNQTIIWLPDKVQILASEMLRDVFSMSGASCREVAEKAMERYSAFEMSVKNQFKTSTDSFDIVVSPSRKTFLLPDACCQINGRTQMRIPETNFEGKRFYRDADFELLLFVDKKKYSTEAFEQFCQSEGGFFLKANAINKEYLVYRPSDLLFMGRYNEQLSQNSVGFGLSSPKSNFGFPSNAKTDDIESWDLGCFKKLSNANVEIIDDKSGTY